MWKYIVALAAIIAGAFILLPNNDNSDEPRPEAVSPQAELRMKQTALQQDVELTNQLCRTECSFLLHQLAAELQNGDKENRRHKLQTMQAEHPHLIRLVYKETAATAEGQTIEAGTVPEEVNKRSSAYLDKANDSLRAGKPYQSEPLQIGNSTYFVIAVPAPDGQGGIVGTVKQHILEQVAAHQRKNLRITPYPSEGRYKIESVDSETLNDVYVDHPEENEGTSHYHINQIVVKFKQQPTEARLQQINKEIQGKHVTKLGNTYIFESAKLEAKQMMNYFTKKSEVEYAEPHFLYLTNSAVRPQSVGDGENGAAFKPNDSLYERYQWNLPLIGTEEGWNIGRGSAGVKIAVIDTGVDLGHPDLSGQLADGVNVVSEDATPQDDVGHGTHVAGIVGALVNNQLGIAGMNWNSKIMPVKVLDSTGAGSTYAVAQGIIWAADHGARVINLSLGNYADAQFLHDAIKYAYDRDVVLIGASGNDNTGQPGYPAAYPEVFAVSATDADRNKASFSNYGDYIDVAAPGVSIASTYPDNQYAALSGTSMASPHVAALASLIRSVNPDLKNTEVMQIMRETAQDLGPEGRDPYYGYGLINVEAALRAAQGETLNNNAIPQTKSRWTRLLEMLFG